MTAPFARVQTERLLLRRPVMDDVEAHFVIHGDPATNQYNPNGPVRSLGAHGRSWLET
ncbi:hypothetical protein [Candidatus Dormibacter sp.]|uniref:hypothetical protein n=1 Tax=Candidatus Dormibacter sp. TaxID=2973982 RepID=UPI0026C78F9C